MARSGAGATILTGSSATEPPPTEHYRSKSEQLQTGSARQKEAPIVAPLKTMAPYGAGGSIATDSWATAPLPNAHHRPKSEQLQTGIISVPAISTPVRPERMAHSGAGVLMLTAS